MLYLFGILIFLTSLVLILLILIQRGRGGGLVGALGGMGGQSAFGTKAGDRLTWITFGVASFWIILSVGAIKVLNQSQSLFGEAGGTRSSFSPGSSQDINSTPVTDTEGGEKTGETPPGEPGTPSMSSGKGDAEKPASPATSESTTKPAAGETPPATSTPATTTSPTGTPPAEAPDEGKK